MLPALILALPVLSGAQAGPSPEWPVAAGSRIRIESPVLSGKKHHATVIAATPDTLFFRPLSNAGDLSLATTQITKLEVAHGKRTRFLKGAALGFVIGAVIGGATAAATYKEEGGPGLDFGRGGTAALGGYIGGVAGLLIGTVYGAGRVDRWVPVSIPRS